MNMMPSYRSVGYDVLEDNLDFVADCNCDKCQKRDKPKQVFLPLPPSETSVEQLDAISQQSVRGFVVHHFLPVLDDCVQQVDWSRMDVSYDGSVIDAATCGRLLFDARRLYSDEPQQHQVRASIASISKDVMNMQCPCGGAYKEFGVAGRVPFDEHPKYRRDPQGCVYVCNGYLSAVVMQFNKKLAYMANLKVRLAKDDETKRKVGRLQKALDKKKSEVGRLLKTHQKERDELADANAKLRGLLKRAQEELVDAHEQTRRLELSVSKQKTELLVVKNSRDLLEHQVATCRLCTSAFTSGSWGGCMGGCSHIFCLDCAKDIVTSRAPDGQPSDYVDALHPSRIYAPTAIKPTCPECDFPSEYITAKKF